MAKIFLVHLIPRYMNEKLPRSDMVYKRHRLVFAKTFHITLSFHRSENNIGLRNQVLLSDPQCLGVRLQCLCVKNIKSDKFITYRKVLITTLVEC